MDRHRWLPLAPLAAAALLGAGAALAPSLLAPEVPDLPALRGLAAGVVALLVAVALAIAWGARGPRRMSEHALEALTLGLALGATLLPALLIHVDWTALGDVNNLLQQSLGWRERHSTIAVAAVILVLAYATSRLWTSLRRQRLSGLSFVAVALLAAVLHLAGAAGQLDRVPAPVGLERFEKLAILGALVTLLIAALPRGAAASRGFDPRALILGLGFCVSALLAAEFARGYLHPKPADLLEVLAAQNFGSQTVLAAKVRGRPDLQGLYVLPNASDSLRLSWVRPIGTWAQDLPRRIVATSWGSAHLEPEPAPRSSPGGQHEGSPETRWRELWVHIALPFRFDLPTGIRAREDVFDWALLPGAQALVASTREPLPATGTPPAGQWRPSSATYAIGLWRVSWLMPEPRALLSNLPLPPRILEVSRRSLRLLIAGESYSRGRLRSTVATERNRGVASAIWGDAPQYLGTTQCDLASFTCAPWKTVPGSYVAVSADGNRLVARRAASLDVLDTRTMEVLHSVPVAVPPRNQAPASKQVLLLDDGRLVEFALTGRMPDWIARVTAYDSTGHLAGVLELGNVRLLRYAGDLGDRTIAVAWRKHYSYSLTRSPVFGWTIESWNPTTGERRRLADDIATLPSREEDPSRVFLDRSGRLVTPTPHGLVDIRRGPSN